MTEIMEIKKQCQLNQWDAMVQSREDSGFNVREYCRRNGIKPSTYYYRLKRLRLETIQMQNEPQIVEFTPPMPETNENNNIIIKTDNADRFLKDFLGILMTDGYIEYNKVSDVIRCCCWVHMRRKWREAMPKDATTETSKAAIGYKYCNKIFALEKQFKDLNDTERLSRRQQKSLKIVDEYYLWVRSLDPVKGSKLAEAVTYALNQEINLRECFNHGEVEIHSNLAENSIRLFVIGRNYALNPIMFCASGKAA